jgi:hypothetical protein
MKNHQQTVKICLQIIFLSLLAVSSVQASGPEYNGKTLGNWLILNLTGDASSQEAIRQIGTNGIPTLIDLVSINEKNVKKVLSKLHDKNLTYYYKFEDNTEVSLEGLNGLGVSGFDILGTNAESAVPQLVKHFDRRDEDFSRIAFVLGKVGPKGFFVLTNAINDTNAGVRDTVIRVISTSNGGDPQVVRQLLINALKDPNTLIRLHAADFLLGKDPDLAMLVLVPLLNDSDTSIRLGAAHSLRGKDPDLIVPALIPLLEVSDYDRCRSDIDKASIYGRCLDVANMLAAYGPAAKTAAPKLLSVFTNVVSGTNEYLIRCLSGTLLNTLRRIDPDTAIKAEDFILNGGPLGVAGFGWTTTRLPNGRELIVGGFYQTTIPIKTDHILSRAQLFDPVTGKRTETGSMNVARDGHAAILLPNGKVLVAGGSDLIAGRVHDLCSAELYDPTTGKWTETGSMNAAHAGGEAVLQHNGKVLFHGELYNPTTGKWTVVTNK